MLHKHTIVLKWLSTSNRRADEVKNINKSQQLLHKQLCSDERCNAKDAPGFICMFWTLKVKNVTRKGRNVSQTEERDTIETKGPGKSAAENLKDTHNDNGSRYGCTDCLRGRWWGVGKAQRLQKHMRLLTGETLDLLWNYDKNVWDKPDFPKPHHVVRERCCKPGQWNNRKVANIGVNSIFYKKSKYHNNRLRWQNQIWALKYKNMVSFSSVFT